MPSTVTASGTIPKIPVSRAQTWYGFFMTTQHTNRFCPSNLTPNNTHRIYHHARRQTNQAQVMDIVAVAVSGNASGNWLCSHSGCASQSSCVPFPNANTLKPKSLTYEHLTSLKHLAGCQPKNDSGPIRQLAPCLLGMSQLWDCLPS